MRFRKNFIYEIIVNVENFYKPFGIRYLYAEKNKKFFEIFAYKSITSKSLVENKEFNVFFVSDYTIFYDAITDKYKNHKEKFLKKLNKFPSAKFKIYEYFEKEDGFLIKCYCNIENNEIRRIEKNLINRSYLIIEALIIFTKPTSVMNKEEKSKNLSEIYRVIKRTCPNSEYEKIVKNLIKISKI